MDKGFSIIEYSFKIECYHDCRGSRPWRARTIDMKTGSCFHSVRPSRPAAAKSRILDTWNVRDPPSDFGGLHWQNRCRRASRKALNGSRPSASPSPSVSLRVRGFRFSRIPALGPCRSCASSDRQGRGIPFDSHSAGNKKARQRRAFILSAEWESNPRLQLGRLG